MGPADEWRARGSIHRLLDHDIFVIDGPAASVDDGDEVALVLHGFPTSSFDWRNSVDTLRARRRVVLYDMLGYGFSDKPDASYTLALQADIVEALAQSLGITRVALVTHDMATPWEVRSLLARSTEHCPSKSLGAC